MKTSSFLIPIALVFTAACAGVFFMTRDSGQSVPSPEIALPTPPALARIAPFPALTPARSESKPASSVTNDGTPSSPPPSAAAPIDQLERRIADLESQVKSLHQAMSGLSLEKASADRQKLFAAEEGYLKADEYAAAGQHAIAGEGYLTFLQNHPDHADARDVMKKARDSFLKAGYKDKAFWVQDEMMKANPQNRRADLEELAHIEKDAGLYDRAMEHMNESAQLDPDVGSRLWKRMYWAWFVQLQKGNTAGIEALNQVQREIAASGVNSPKLNQRVQERMTEMRQQLARGQ